MESMTRPAQRKKMTKGSGPLTAFSSKGGYDGVFSAPAAAQRFKPPAAVEDYTEIFGGGSRASSIPVLDLSSLDQTAENFRSSKLDYHNIFGGFIEDLGVPYEELLKKAEAETKCENDKPRNHSEKEFPLQEVDTCNLSGNSEEPPSEVSDPSLDAMKQFNMSFLKTTQGNKSQPNGTTHVAKLHAVPGFTYFVNEPPSKQKAESGMPIPPAIGEVHRTWSFSANIPDENNKKTEMRLPSKPTAEGISGAKGGSQSKDGSLNGRESYLKSQSFTYVPSSNHPLGSSGIRGHPERSKSSHISSKANPFERSSSNGTDGSSDEELYINSDAAACAASLKRVLEKAQESIRLAKEIRERGQNDGMQSFSNLSSEYISKAKDKKKHRIYQEANSSKKQNVKDRHERLETESDERNRRLGSRTTGVSTASKCNQESLTSTEAGKGKSPLDNTEVDRNSKQFLDLLDTKKSSASTLAYDQVEMDTNTTSTSMRKQESVTSLSMEKQEILIGETTILEPSEQVENNVEIGKPIDKDFGMGNSENNIHVDEHAQVLEVTANASDSAPVKHEFRTTAGLETTEKKDARYEDMNCILDEPRHCEVQLPECFGSSIGKNPEPSKIEYQHMLTESQNLAEKEEQNLANCGDYNEEQLKLQFAYSQGEKVNGLYCCNEGSMVPKEACGFVVSDDAPDVCSSGSLERIHKDGQEGDASGTSNDLNSCNEGGAVQQEACGFLESDDAPEVCGNINRDRRDIDDQEGEACVTLNAIHEIGVDDSVLISEHKGEEAPTLPYEELMTKVVEDIDHTENELLHVPNEEKRTQVLKDQHWKEEDQTRSEETYNQLKVDWNEIGEEFDWGEVEKRIKKGCITEDTKIVWSEKHKSACQNAVEIIQETEENTSVHVENDVFDHAQIDLQQKAAHEKNFETEENKFVHVENDFYDHEQIDLLQKAAHEKHFDPDAYVSMHDDQEEVHRNTALVDDHEASNSTTGTSEEFYNCEWEGNSEEEVLKGCELENTKLDEKDDFAQCPFEDRVSSTGTPFPSMNVESDGNGTNADHDDLIREHKVSQKNVLETTNSIQNAEKDNDIMFKLQDVSENKIATKIDFSADTQGTVADENVKGPEPSPSPESGGDFLYRFRENSDHVPDEFSFDKEEEDIDPKVVCKLENKEKEIKETQNSSVTHQATVTQESVEELITGQNIQFVRTKPQENALPEDNEPRESQQKDLKEKEHSRKVEAIKKERERDKDRIAVERAIREARERAFAEVRERAERAAVARAGAEVRQRMMAESQDKLEKSNAGTKLADKASIEAKQRAERAAVERATAEARERALEKALSQKSTAQEHTDRLSGTAKDSGLKHSFSTSDLERFDGNNSESAQRRKAKLERHERIMERAAKALADKNMRDLQAQKEQAERNRLAESLDADVKRWASGKERNLRALLSTLQYILGPESGWQPVSLTEIITTDAVKKAYRKATLYVHPDKLQQRGASIQQKYICEKVFYLLKAAWSKFNSEER